MLNANTVADIDSVFAALKAMPVDALIVSANPFFGTQNRDLLARLVTEARIHAVFPTEVLAIEYLERNPKPGTEGDPPSPPWWVDVRALRDAEASGPAPPPA